MSDEQGSGSSSYTSVTIDDDISMLLDDISDTYGLRGRASSVRLLCDVFDVIDAPTDITSILSDSHELLDPEFSTIRGLMIDNPALNETRLVGVGRDTAHVITDATTHDTDDVFQALARTDITDGDVYCPVCSSIIMDYQLSDSLPGVQSGVFNDLTLTCTECGEKREYYMLFVTPSYESFTPDSNGLARAMEQFFAYALLIDSYPFDEFATRVDSCRDLARDSEITWLPHPSRWIGFTVDSLEGAEVTTERYVDFTKNYVTHLIETNTDVGEVDITAIPPSDTSDMFVSMWQLQVDVRNGDVSEDLGGYTDFIDSWSDSPQADQHGEVTVDVKFVEMDSFSDSTAIVTFNGLTDL